MSDFSAIIDRAIEWSIMIMFASCTSVILYLIDLHENNQKATWYGALLKALGGGLAGAFAVLICAYLNWSQMATGIACGSVGAIGASFIRDIANTIVGALKAALLKAPQQEGK